MANFLIKGGKPLSGSISPSYAKNSALPAMYASVLTSEPSVIEDVPRIEEVERTREILNSIGAKNDWVGEHTLKITPSAKLTPGRINYHAAIKTRAVIMLIGALSARYHNFNIPTAGGCKLGKRTVNPHIFALENFGFKIKVNQTNYKVSAPAKTHGTDFVLYEMGDTPTENAVLAAVLAEGKTIIRKASSNYMVQDLCHLLVSMGAKIKGIGTPTLEIVGVKSLHGIRGYHLMPDPIASGLLISVAATTNSHLTLKGIPRDFIEVELEVLKHMNWQYKILRVYKSKSKNFDLLDIETFPSKLLAPADKIEAHPYPGINIDNLPYFVPIATQAKGQTLIHDWTYENRAIHYMELIKLGANMVLADPHRIYINGPTPLSAGEVICPPALRPASLLVVAMLAAHGKSIIRNTYAIERGFDNLYESLKNIGAEIEKIG